GNAGDGVSATRRARSAAQGAGVGGRRYDQGQLHRAGRARRALRPRRGARRSARRHRQADRRRDAPRHRVSETELLYYTEAYLRDFGSEVVAVDPDRHAVALAATAFFPTGG